MILDAITNKYPYYFHIFQVCDYTRPAIGMFSTLNILRPVLESFALIKGIFVYILPHWDVREK